MSLFTREVYNIASLYTGIGVRTAKGDIPTVQGGTRVSIHEKSS